MPLGIRVRANNVFGLVADNPLAAGVTSMNSSGLVNLPAISASQHAIIVLDPLRVNGAPEIVIVTAHGALSPTATITRAAYGTVTRSHPSGTMWMHTPVDEDYIEILTSITRPTDPYEGQFIFETDTNKLVGYGGVDWAPRDAGGQLGYNSSTTGQANIVAEVDVTGCSIAVTVGTSRRIKVTGRVNCTAVAGTGVAAYMLVKEGVTEIGRASSIVDSGREMTMISESVLTPSAGSHTYKLTLQGGTISTVSLGSSPNFILVEDIGAA